MVNAQVFCSLGCDNNTGSSAFVSFIFLPVDSYFSRFEEEIELQLAIGNLDLETLERIDDFNPDKITTKVPTHKIIATLKTKEQLTILKMSF